MIKRYIFILLLSVTLLSAYQSQEELRSVIVGKVAKYISWPRSQRQSFVITLLNGHNFELFKRIYKDKTINNKPVEIHYIENIKELQATDILYIATQNSQNLLEILQQVPKKGVLTVSSIRGFVQKGGILQIYFSSQKARLKINLHVAKQEHLEIKSSLLRIADVIR